MLVALCCLLSAGCRTAGDSLYGALEGAPIVEQQDSGTDELLIGLHAVDDRVVWASGTGGTFVRTVDGGRSWHAGVVAGADTLQFRDVHAQDADVAWLLSIGTGPSSRIYRTTDGGATWREVFVSSIDEAFFDCFDFWPDRGGIAFSDAVGGRFPLAFTRNGETWSARSGPEAQDSEGGFAASGTCLITMGDRTVFIGTGNAEIARVLRSEDGGRTWQGTPTPLVSGEAAGITSLAFRDERHGAALGGDLTQPEAFTDNVAVTEDGGRTWHLAGRPSFAGAVYGSSYVPGTSTIVAVGPNGMSYSHDDAASWRAVDSLSYWSVDFFNATAGWAVGPDGRIAKLRFPSAN